MNPQSPRYVDYTIPGAKKSTIPEIGIRKGIFHHTGEPLFGIDYRFAYCGMHVPCHSLEEAFRWLEHYAEEDGFRLEDCRWNKDSEYALTDRHGSMVQATLF